MANILIKNTTVVTLGENNQVLPNYSVVITNDKITQIAPASQIQGKFDKVINGKNKITMPGFINAHMHFYSTLVRGLGKALPSKNFNEILHNLWWRLDQKLSMQDNYVSAMFPLINAIRHGTTTIIDHHASPNVVRGSLNTIAGAVKESGLRACLCYEVSDRDGDKITQDGIIENAEFIASCKKEKDSHLTALFGLHASFTVGEKTLAQCVEVAQKLDAGFHVHTAEALSDQDSTIKAHGMRVVERFAKAGILGPKTICAHCVHVNEKEIDLLASTKTNVVHNPQSNINNAVGVAPVLDMFAKNVRVGLGTDAMTVNMLEELRVCLWIHKLANNNPSVGFMESMQTLFTNNAHIANTLWPNLGIGKLEVGGVADMVLIDYYSPTEFSPATFYGHMGFGVSQSFVDTTICAGKILLENKELKLNIDEEKLAYDSQVLAKDLWDRF